jgi:hypothetical protein
MATPMIEETQNLRRARPRVMPVGTIQPLTVQPRARFEGEGSSDEIADAVRASRLARGLMAEVNRNPHDVELTLARHVLRLEQRLADLTRGRSA